MCKNEKIREKDVNKHGLDLHVEWYEDGEIRITNKKTGRTCVVPPRVSDEEKEEERSFWAWVHGCTEQAENEEDSHNHE